MLDAEQENLPVQTRRPAVADVDRLREAWQDLQPHIQEMLLAGFNNESQHPS